MSPEEHEEVARKLITRMDRATEMPGNQILTLAQLHLSASIAESLRTIAKAQRMTHYPGAARSIMGLDGATPAESATLYQEYYGSDARERWLNSLNPEQLRNYKEAAKDRVSEMMRQACEPTGADGSGVTDG